MMQEIIKKLNREIKKYTKSITFELENDYIYIKKSYEYSTHVIGGIYIIPCERCYSLTLSALLNTHEKMIVMIAVGEVFIKW